LTSLKNTRRSEIRKLLTIILNSIYGLPMYVCLCKGITDRQLEQAVEYGASSFREVRDELGVSTQCGKCTRLARAIVDESLKKTLATADYYNASLA
jgi:bacterioferritin-associated ferredoxin